MALKKTPPRQPNPNSGAIPRPPPQALQLNSDHSVRRGGAASRALKRPKGQFLERAEFAVLLALTMIAAGLINHFGPLQIADAKAARDGARWWMANGFLILANLVAFWYSMRLCVRRYRDLVGDPRISIWTQGWIRGALLSPIFSMQLVAILLFFEGANSGAKPSPSFSAKAWVFALSTLLAHAVWLGVSLHFHTITWDQNSARFRPHAIEVSNETAALQQDLKKASVLEPYRDIHDLVLVHVMPYLNITLHAALMTGKDFDRADALLRLTVDKKSRYCQKRRPYLGFDVDDCYWTHFLALNKTEPFVTPWAPLMFSMRWKSERQHQSMGISADPTQIPPEAMAQHFVNARQSMAGAVLMLENAVSVFEGAVPKRAISDATRPHGLLPYLGNVELPVVSLVQEMQKLLLSKTLAGKIREQLPEIRQGLSAAGEALGSSVQSSLLTRLNSVDSRLQTLEDREIFSAAIWTQGEVH